MTQTHDDMTNHESADAPQDNATPPAPLRSGWTTGACATAATKAALTALITGEFPDPVAIILPKGEVPHFQLALQSLGDGYASAGIIKDAGDDPDVTHGALIIATVYPGPPESGVTFVAGEGVGTVTRPGLTLAVGEAAINPMPRQMMRTEVEELCHAYGLPADVVITISVPDGEKIAQQTMNGRLGIVGGISILGTTGIVHPFSCSAWIHSIHRGIDVARADGQTHLLAPTGSTSQDMAQALYHLPETAIIDMGDFVGAVLKYLRHHPVERLTLSGGFAKFTKLAQGALDLHSKRSQIDTQFLWQIAAEAGMDTQFKDMIQTANTAKQVLDLTQQNNIDIVTPIAKLAYKQARKTLHNEAVKLDLMIGDRQGKLLAHITAEDLDD